MLPLLFCIANVDVFIVSVPVDMLPDHHFASGRCELHASATMSSHSYELLLPRCFVLSASQPMTFYSSRLDPRLPIQLTQHLHMKTVCYYKKILMLGE